MPKLPWDRTLETCVKRKMNALLTANQPPYWRSHAGLCAGLVPSLDSEDIITMLDEIAPTPESGRMESLPGCRSFRLIYGTDKFRVDALGEPTTHSVILTRLPRDAPALLRKGFGWYQGWHDEGRQMDLDQLLECAEQIDGDALVVPGCPPLVWTRLGLHAYSTAPFDDDAVCSMIDEMMPPSELCLHKRGLVNFSVHRHASRNEHLAEVFGHPSPTMALLIGLKEGSLCDLCRSPTTIHPTQICNGTLTQSHLCPAHYDQERLPPDPPTTNN
jgi:hypothetical protein